MSKCKKLVRKDVRYSKYSIGGIPFLKPHPYWPTIGNPIYTAIFSRGIRRKANEGILETNIAISELDKKIDSLQQDKQPDLIVADYNSLFIPAVKEQIESPFFINGTSFYSPQVTDNFSYGLGLSLMFYAFDNIKLGKIYWPKVISDGLNLYLNEKPTT